jgi:hypothetical protein
VGELDRTGDATGFACALHGNFKVANTVFAEQRAKDYSREEWEAALRKAKQRAKPDQWPLINSNDF